MQRPTIGRVVHFNWGGARVPAAITYVHSDTCINLARLDGQGSYSSVSYAEEPPESAAKLNEMTTQNATWSWPPRVG